MSRRRAPGVASVLALAALAVAAIGTAPAPARAQAAGEIRADVDVTDLLKLSHAISVACEYPSAHSDQAQRLLTVMLDGLRSGAAPQAG